MKSLYFKPSLAVLFWGVSFIATKSLLDELTPLTVIYLRLFLGAIFIAAVAVKRKRSFIIRRSDFIGLFLLAAIAIFHLWIQVEGLNYTSASNTGWIIGLAPVFIALLGVLLFKEKISPLQFAGIFIAFAGLLFLVGKGDITNIKLAESKGDLLVLGSAFTWAVYSHTGKKVTLNYPPMMTIFYQFAFMFIILTPFVLAEGSLPAAINLNSTGVTAILFLGILCSGAAYVFWASAMKELDSAKVGALLYFEPFITVIAAWLLLGEELTLSMLVSGIVIIVGVILVNRKS